MTSEPGKPVKITLVEDDPMMRSVLKTLLEIEGFKVFLMPDRKTLDELLACLKEASPDLVLLDVHLRSLNGIDLLKRIRAEEGFGSLKVIMSSGMDMKDQCLKAGADGFLMKPYMPDELMKALRGLN